MSTLDRNAGAHLADADLIWQQCLFAFDDPAVDRTFAGRTRTLLSPTSWIDHVPGWLHGADLVFAELVAKLPWRQREVIMYQQRMLEPRLTTWWNTTMRAPEPLPVLAEARTALSEHYARPFDSIGFNLYRDGRDSVAWHADRVPPHFVDPMVVILSTGATRSFLVRPKGGGHSSSWQLHRGDLLVMGGDCQAEFEHCVPKVAQAAGPRLSIMFRHDPRPE